MLCDVAWARAHGTATFLIPEGQTSAAELAAKAAERNMPGLPTTVVQMFEAPMPGTCGACTAFDKDSGMGADRQLQVGARDQSCVLFVARPS